MRRVTLDFMRDVRFGARNLLASPAFTATALLTLALTTGATTAIFSIVNGVLFRPLPFADPDRLVQVYGRAWAQDREGQGPDPMTAPIGSLELEEYARQSTSFEAFTGYAPSTLHLDDRGGRERLTAVAADLNFFTVLGARPEIGRAFRSDDPLDVVVLSSELWRRRFGADPALLGRTIVLDGRARTVLGIMPDGFQFPYGATTLPAALPESRTDLWVPLPPLRTASGELRRGRVDVTGRLRQGVARQAAEAELGAIARRVEEQQGPGVRRIQARLVPQADVVVGPVRRSLWMLFASVGLVLAAACANVANLLLARMMVRTHEIATRAALGASRIRLIRQFLAESLLLAFAGGLLGVFVARAGTQLLLALGSAKIPRAREVGLDWQTFAFLALACLVVAVAFGLAPALTAARLNLQVVMRGAGGHATMGRAYGRLREALVVTEVALAFLLLLGAALVMRELFRLRNEDTGMVTQNVLTMHLTPRATADVYYQIEDRVARLPGVHAAGFTQLLPLQHWGWDADFSVPGITLAERWVAGLRYVTPGYFDALAIPVVRGRALEEGDHADAQPVILVNEALVRRYLGEQEPLGLETDRGTIVGVVGDVRQVSLGQPAEPEIYYAAAQNITMAPDLGMTLLVRTSGGPASADLIRSAVLEVHPTAAIFNVRTMEQVLSDSLWELNLYRWLIGLYAALAVGLAAIGLYGVVSYTVGARTREFAVRMALGSRPGPLARDVIARGALLALVGLALGALGTLAVAPALARLTAALRVDAATSASVAALVLVIAVAACALPAQRVRSLELSRALRQE